MLGYLVQLNAWRVFPVLPSHRREPPAHAAAFGPVLVVPKASTAGLRAPVAGGKGQAGALPHDPPCITCAVIFAGDWLLPFHFPSQTCSQLLALSVPQQKDQAMSFACATTHYLNFLGCFLPGQSLWHRLLTPSCCWSNTASAFLPFTFTALFSSRASCSICFLLASLSVRSMMMVAWNVRHCKEGQGWKSHDKHIL